MATIDDIRQDEIDYCKNHPGYFVRTYCHRGQGRRGDYQPFALWPAQEEALDTIHAARLSIILKARQLGMTWLCCAMPP